ncbi:MAG: hypothetical protein DRR11_06185 [Gammaproteobacteria bacterium]|nr:MAG: hypothetical protein DRR11_06185 [Gammaproteobacteria bacterium]RLA36073.1 MAG: hypothetical protein DRR15_05755 [Gammaproteobacteria bacterium]
MTDIDSISVLARTLVGELITAGKCVSTAESCTGGWIAKSLTDISGSSQCFGYGVVSYSNGAKESMLGVAAATLSEHGAVSEAAVREMATGVLNLSGADFSVAVSGVAGPDGGTDEKPVGTVWFGWAMRTGQKMTVKAEQHNLQGDRAAIRSGTVILALQGIREMLVNGG